MLKSKKPVVAVTAVRTGCGKSQTTRKIASILKDMGKKVVVVRHPMPYGNLTEQVCQKFTTMKDMHTNKCTIEEREEYEPLIEMGVVLFAGVDYEKILKAAEREIGNECGVIVWDGGNNDTPFFSPDLHITLVDPLRPNHEKSFYPGETNFRMADVIIINKEKSAKPSAIKTIKDNIKKYNPNAVVIDAASAIMLDKPELIKGKRVLVIEDGPTLTHGGMAFGAGTIAARRFGAKPIDPRPYATGSIKEIFKKYPHLKNVLPAMGYTPSQLKELKNIINNVVCDAVVSGTPIDLRRVLNTNKPILRIRYELQEIGKPTLSDVLEKLVKRIF